MIELKGTLTEEEALTMYDEMLDDSHFIQIGELTFDASTVLKECDPIGYRVGFADFADYLAKEGNPVEGYN